ncbi:hypothetical protein JCM10207_000648 [Rhodosporidiobolus poonsookiae]
MALATPSRAGSSGRKLGDLPTELKAKIVKLCDEQDKRFLAWHAELGEREVARQPYPSQRAKKPLLTVRALYEVSKEWSAISGELIFQVVKASKADLIFKSAVVHKHASSIRHIVLDTDRLDRLETLLTAVPHFRSINAVTVHRVSVTGLWGNFTPSLDFNSNSRNSELVAIVRPILRQLFWRVTSLELPSPHAMLALYTSSALRTLSVQVTRDSFPGGDYGESLVQLLNQLEHLYELHITGVDRDNRDLSSTSETFKSILPSHFLNIKTLSIDCSARWSTDPFTAARLAHLANFPTLTLLRLVNLPWLSPTQQETLDELCHQHSLVLETFASAAFPVAASATPAVDDLDALVKETTLVLSFMQKQIEIAKAEGNVNKLKEMRSRLKEFEEERLISELWRAA